MAKGLGRPEPMDIAADAGNGAAVLDLFCGMGGLALGFARAGFRVIGYDIHPRVPEIFRINRLGEAVRADLGEADPIRPEHRAVRLVVGGPPCRPWSALNRHNPGLQHPDHRLLHAFFRILEAISPEAFLMENVPPLASDLDFRRLIARMAERYDMDFQVVRYSDFGAATARRRLILVGFRRAGLLESRARWFFERLETLRGRPRPVREVLEPYRALRKGEFPDHEWPEVRSIPYWKYEANWFGWQRLDPDRPAPSFGNIMKTYILNPLVGNRDGDAPRVLSVREAMAIMGFPPEFRFPEGMGMSTRYQMVADAVSPVFSEKCAMVMRDLL